MKKKRIHEIKKKGFLQIGSLLFIYTFIISYSPNVKLDSKTSEMQTQSQAFNTIYWLDELAADSNVNYSYD